MSLIPILVGLMTLLVSMSGLIDQPVMAQKGTGESTGIARQGLKPNVLRFEGRIIKIKTGPCEKRNKTPQAIGSHLIVQTTGKQMLNLHVGPEQRIQMTLNELPKDKTLIFTAFKTDRLSQDAYILKTVELGKQVWVFRNNDLTPAWSRGGGKRQSLGQ
jgi:hypothetical protein